MVWVKQSTQRNKSNIGQLDQARTGRSQTFFDVMNSLVNERINADAVQALVGDCKNTCKEGPSPRP